MKSSINCSERRAATFSEASDGVICVNGGINGAGVGVHTASFDGGSV